MNCNAQIVNEHLRKDSADEHHRRMAEARRIAIENDKARTIRTILTVFGVALFVCIGIPILGWLAFHAIGAAFHYLGVTLQLAFVVATVAGMFRSGGIVSAIRYGVQLRRKWKGSRAKVDCPLPEAKGVVAVASCVAWLFGVSQLRTFPWIATPLLMMSMPLLIATVMSYKKHAQELSLLDAGYSSEVEAIYHQIKREEESEFADSVAAHMENFSAGAPPTPTPVEGNEPPMPRSTLPERLDWNNDDDSPLRPM